jgi:hypothetical protein
MHNQVRSTTAPAHHSLSQKDDIADNKIDHSVYEFTKDLVDTMPHVRSEVPYLSNGPA